MYSLIFAAVIVSLFCYCGNNYTIFNTFYYDEPTPKTYQATALKYKSEKVNNNKQLECDNLMQSKTFLKNETQYVTSVYVL